MFTISTARDKDVIVPASLFVSSFNCSSKLLIFSCKILFSSFSEASSLDISSVFFGVQALNISMNIKPKAKIILFLYIKNQPPF